MSKEAMQLALEALENAGEAVYARGGIAAVGSLNIAAQALRQALETEQEPVAWLDPEENISDEAFTWSQSKHHTVPLYTAPPKRDLTCVCGAVWEGETMVHPPRKREWVGLTDEEIVEIAATPAAIRGSYVHSFARAIEQALNEKNT